MINKRTIKITSKIIILILLMTLVQPFIGLNNIAEAGTTMGGITYEINGSTLKITGGTQTTTPSGASSWGWNSSNGTITNIEITGTVNLTNARSMFSGMTLVESITGLENINMSNVTDMSWMFYDCRRLKNVDFGNNWKTSNVTNMQAVFNQCNSLTTLDLSGWRTQKVTNMEDLFNNCQKLESINFGNYWNTSNVTNMSAMFFYCRALKTFNVNNWNVSNVINTSSMFEMCTSIETLDLSSWDTSNVTNSMNMLSKTGSLTVLKCPERLSNDMRNNAMRNESILNKFMYDKDKNYESTPNMVAGHTLVSSSQILLISFDANGGTCNTENKIVGYRDMYGEMPTPTREGYTFVGWYTSKMDGAQITSDMTATESRILYARWTATEGKLIEEAMGIEFYYENNHNTLVIVGGTQTSSYVTVSSWGWYNWAAGIKEVIIIGDVNLTNASVFFYNMLSLETITGLEKIKLNNVTDVSSMFDYCRSLTTLNLNSWNTSNVTNMNSMFCNCEKLTTLNLSNWDTSNVTNMHSMFVGCRSLETLDLSNWDTSKVNDAVAMLSMGGSGFPSKLKMLKCPRKLSTETRSTNVWLNTMYDLNDNCNQVNTMSEEHTLVSEIPKITVTFNANGGTVTTNTKTVTYNSKYGYLEDALKTGYTFEGWYTEANGGIKITEDDKVTTLSNQTLYAHWTLNQSTRYIVEHYLRKTDREVELYDIETEEKEGTIDTQVTAIYREYTGFTKDESNVNKVETGIIAEDGSLVLKLYYERNTYSVTYELNGGTTTDNLKTEYLYGTSYNIPTSGMKKEGYIFIGWYNNIELTGKKVIKITEEEAENKTLYAKWVEKEAEYYIIPIDNIYEIDEENKEITKVKPGTTVSEMLSNIETSGTIRILDKDNVEKASNDKLVTGDKLEVTYNGIIYTYEISVTGDVQANGLIDIKDLVRLNQAVLGKITLEGVYYKSADVNSDGELTITDLVKLNKVILGRTSL